MSECSKRILKNQYRLLESDLSNLRMELLVRMRLAAETGQMVDFLTEQVALVKAQLDKCS